MKKEKPVPLHEMTLRDFFAALIASGRIMNSSPGINDEKIAEKAYSVADALLKEREK